LKRYMGILGVALHKKFTIKSQVQSIAGLTDR
jgi:hypothetical protein